MNVSNSCFIYTKNMWNANKFEYIIISFKCTFKVWVLRYCMIMIFLWWDMGEAIINSYFVLIWRWDIPLSTKGCTWKCMFDHEKQKYKYYLEWIWDNVHVLLPKLGQMLNNQGLNIVCDV